MSSRRRRVAVVLTVAFWRLSRGIGAGVLLAVAAVHVGWGPGSSWPAPDERSLARAVGGDDEMPPPGACFAVAALLTLASALVFGLPRRSYLPRRVGVSGVFVALSARGGIGAFGLMPRPYRDSETFTWWDWRLYSALCLTLASLISLGLEDSERNARSRR